MSVKNKVKRLNKRIAELENEMKKVKSESVPINQIFKKQELDKTREYKDNFLKLILHEKLSPEHNCYKIRIPVGQLEIMQNARLKVERDYEWGDNIIFTLKV